MPSLPPSLARPYFFSLTSEGLRQTVVGWGWAAFRADQLLHSIYHKLVIDVTEIRNLPAADRRIVAQRLEIASAATTRQQDSSDGTSKLLLTWPDGKSAETVLIPEPPRFTACVSSQVGCPVGCKFCASGLGGMQGNLSAGQIVEQIFHLNRLLTRRGGGRISNVVFMGMGEPMANYANVMQAVRILHEPKCFGLSARSITISTVGVPARMRELADENLPLNLAISLHAPDEQLRRQLIPWAEHFALEEILDAARYYFEKTGREITLEYILLSGVNDRPEHARSLAKLCHTLRANVNLIRYNPVEGLPYERPKSDDVVAFQAILREAGVNAHVRKSRGRDIDAACGQLRRKSEVSQ